MNTASITRFARVCLPLLASMSVTASAQADSLALVAMPLPPGAVSRSVAFDIVHDGRSTSIASLRSVASLDDVLAFYRDSWPESNGEIGHLEERVGEWSILSRIEGRTMLVVQLREGVSGPEGFISSMALDAGSSSAIPPPPIPAGGQLVSSTAGRDGASVSSTSVVSSTARPGEVVAFYRDRLVRDGWTIVSDRTHGDAFVLLLDRRAARVEVVVTDLGGHSVVVVNEVRLDG